MMGKREIAKTEILGYRSNCFSKLALAPDLASFIDEYLYSVEHLRWRPIRNAAEERSKHLMSTTSFLPRAGPARLKR